MLAPAIWVIIAWAAAGTVWAATWIAINRDGYDTPGEAMVSVGTELGVWWATWALGWGVASWVGITGQKVLSPLFNGNKSYLIGKWLWVDGAKMLSEWGGRNAIIFGADLAILWVWSEWWRHAWVRSHYDEGGVFEFDAQK